MNNVKKPKRPKMVMIKETIPLFLKILFLIVVGGLSGLIIGIIFTKLI